MNLFDDSNPNDLLQDIKQLIGDKWYNILDHNELLSIAELLKEIKNIEKEDKVQCYPKHEICMRSLKLIDPNDVNVIVISKCPYPNDNADGIPFSCARYHSESIKQIYFGITELITTFNTHTHNGNLGYPTGIPLNPIVIGGTSVKIL